MIFESIMIILSLANLVILLAIGNEILDIKDFIFYKEVLEDEQSDLN